MLIVAYALIVVALVGWTAFRLQYRPLWLGGHSRVGRHLVRTADSMIALLALTLVQNVLPLPMWLHLLLTILVAAGLCVVAWERVLILRRGQRQRREQIQ